MQELWPGDTLTIRGGVYRESVQPWRSGTAGNPVVVRAYPGEEGNVVISGSALVEGWSHEGGDLWSADAQPFPLIDYPPGWVDYGEYSRRREMVFIDGVRLNQVVDPNDLTDGSFWVDVSNKKIRLKLSSDPNHHSVEVSTRELGIWAHYVSYFEWIGLTVEHVSNDLFTGAMNLGDNHRVTNCRVENNNQVGIMAFSESVIQGTIASNNGRTGMNIGGSNSLLDSNVTNENSWRYGPRWAAAGVSLISNRPSWNRIVRHTARNNNSRGIWLDTTGSGNVIESCQLENNLIAGLRFEAAQGPNWAINNIVVGTRSVNDGQSPNADGAGIDILESTDSRLYNNTIKNVSGSGIVIEGNERSGGQDYIAQTQVYNNIVEGSGVAAVRFWVWGDARLEERIASHHFDHNLYHGGQTDVIFPDLNGWKEEHWSLADWQHNRGEDLTSIDQSASFVQSQSSDPNLRPDSPAIDTGITLPEVLDDYLGSTRPQGNQTDIGAIETPTAYQPEVIIFFDDFSSPDLTAWTAVIGN